MSMLIDAHLHLWDPGLGVYHWLDRAPVALRRAFRPQEAHRVLATAGVDGVVLVQAADSALDTAALLVAADTCPWVRGVIGWLDLEHPDQATASLDGPLAHARLCGLRQLIHDDPRDGVLALPTVRSTLAVLAARDLPLDIPDAHPRLLDDATDAAWHVDGLRLVLDHLGKPPRGRPTMADWAAQVRDFAAAPGTLAKVSGLWAANAPWTTNALRPVWDLALNAFGPTRLMLGSDWPMSIPQAGYADILAPLLALVSELSPDEQDDLQWRTATRAYRLDLPTPGEVE